MSSGVDIPPHTSLLKRTLDVLEDVLAELDGLIGLERVKHEGQEQRRRLAARPESPLPEVPARLLAEWGEPIAVSSPKLSLDAMSSL
jgi:hypothetical protein